MNGPSPCSVATKSALTSASTSESCTPVFVALVGISSLESANAIGDVTRKAVIIRAINAFLLCIIFPRICNTI